MSDDPLTCPAALASLQESYDACGCGVDPCASELGAYDIPFHVGAVFIIFAASAAGVLSTMLGKHVPSLRLSDFSIGLGKAAGAGIVISTALIHMLLPSNASLTSPCVPASFNDEYPAYAYLFCVFAALAMQALEYNIGRCIIARVRSRGEGGGGGGGELTGGGAGSSRRDSVHHHHHGASAEAPAGGVCVVEDCPAESALAAAECCADAGCPEAECCADAGCPEAECCAASAVEEAADAGVLDVLSDLESRRGTATLRRVGGGGGAAAVVGPTPLSTPSTSLIGKASGGGGGGGGGGIDMASLAVVAVPSLSVATEKPHAHHDHAHAHAHHDHAHHDHEHSHGHTHGGHHGHSHGGALSAALWANASKDGGAALVSAVLMEVGFAVHSVFIGLAVGVVSDADLTPLLIALCFHQLFEGVALGARISDAALPNMYDYVFALVFALSAPVGIAAAVGAISSGSISTNSSSFLLVQGTFDGICAGILLYIGFAMLLIDFPKDLQRLCDGPAAPVRGATARRTALFVALWGGAGAMAVIGRYL